MATNRSIFHFSGKVGNVIGYYVRGHKYFRSCPAEVRNPQTPAQQRHRTHFGLASSFVRSVGSIYKTGYQYYNVDVCQRANFLSQVYHHAITPSLTLDPMKVLIAQGTLPQFVATAVTSSQSSITLRWSRGRGNAADQLNLLLYNATRAVALSREDVAQRADGSYTMAVPEEWQTDHLILYAFWHNPAQRTVSDSVVAAQLNAPDAAENQELALVELKRCLTSHWRLEPYSPTADADAAGSQPSPPPPDTYI